MLPVRIACRLRSSGLLLPFLVPVGVLVIFPVRAGGQMPTSSLGASSVGNATTGTTVVPSTVQGQVINASTGAPVPRALVRLNSRAVLTDHDGKFRFDQNTESSANILVTKPGYSASTEMQEAGNLFLHGGATGSAAGVATLS